MTGWYILAGVIYSGVGSGLGATIGVKGMNLVVFALLWPVVLVGALVKVGIDWTIKSKK